MNNVFENMTAKELEIFSIIHRHGVITKKQLQEMVDIPLTSLNRIVRKLEECKLISPIGNAESTGGRKATEYSVCDSGIYLIGIDISRTYVEIVLTNLRLKILQKILSPMNQSFSPEKTIQFIVHSISQMLERLQIDANDVLGIGVGTVGPIERVEGIMLEPQYFFNEDWHNVPIKSAIERETAISCCIDNGANAAAWAEYLFGTGKNINSLAYIHCGVGIRSAAINNGNLIRTMNDTEDAFGHMVINYNESCDAGRGWVESYSSIEAVLKKYNEQAMQNGNEYLVHAQDYQEIISRAINQEKFAKAVLTDGAEILGLGLTNLVRLMNPQLIVLCGPLVNQYEPYYESCISSYSRHCGEHQNIQFSKGGCFGEDTIAIGSCLMVLEDKIKKN